MSNPKPYRKFYAVFSETLVGHSNVWTEAKDEQEALTIFRALGLHPLRAETSDAPTSGGSDDQCNTPDLQNKQ